MKEKAGTTVFYLILEILTVVIAIFST